MTLDPNKMVAKNIGKPINRVKCAELERSSDSLYMFNCPVCTAGVVGIERDTSTFKLKDQAYCFLCGQHFLLVDLWQYEKSICNGFPKDGSLLIKNRE